MRERNICIWKPFSPKIFWLFKSINKQQYPTHESCAVCEAHEEEKQHSNERGLDGPLHQQGHTGKIHSKPFPLVSRALRRELLRPVRTVECLSFGRKQRNHDFGSGSQKELRIIYFNCLRWSVNNLNACLLSCSSHESHSTHFLNTPLRLRILKETLNFSGGE